MGGDPYGDVDGGGDEDHGRGEERIDLSSPGGVEQFTSGILGRAKDRCTDDGSGGGGFSSFSGHLYVFIVYPPVRSLYW